jgi:signal peptide peptidase SppA
MRQPNGKIIDILAAPWAIEPMKLREMTEIYGNRLRDESEEERAARIAAVEAKLGRELDNTPKNYSIEGDGVAVIPVHGVIAKRMNWFMEISGGVSTQLLGRDIRMAVNDPNVHSLILSVDSPGGTVDGTEELANLVHEARNEKAIITHGDGSMFSAAYWIGSSADRIFLSGNTAGAGSIGVVAQHIDYSEYEQKRGIKVTEITAGKYKRVASQHAPLTAEGRATIQAQLDHIYKVFVDTVARNRRTSSDDVLDRMADGRIFLGKQAKESGLVDGFATLEDLVGMLDSERAARTRSRSIGG